MDRSGAMELRKLFSKYVEGECAAGNLAGCVITSDKSIKGEFVDKFQKNEKKTILKYYTLFKKVLANNNADISFSETDKEKDGRQFLLDKISVTELGNKDLNHVLYERIAEAVPEGNYAVLLLNYHYDVPIKTKDKQKISAGYGGDGIYGNESEEVYKFFICAVCPVKIDKESLGVVEDKIGENPQLKTINPPVFGFLFPNFTDRSADIDTVSCFRTAKYDLSEKLFGKASPAIEVKPAKKTEKGPAATRDQGNPSIDTGNLPVANQPAEESYGQSHEREVDKSSDDGMTVSEVQAALNMPRLNEKPVKITGPKELISKRLIGNENYWVVKVEDASLG